MILASTKSVAAVVSAVPLSTWMKIGAGLGVGALFGRGIARSVSKGLHWTTGKLKDALHSDESEVTEAIDEAPLAAPSFEQVRPNG